MSAADRIRKQCTEFTDLAAQMVREHRDGTNGTELRNMHAGRAMSLIFSLRGLGEKLVAEAAEAKQQASAARDSLDKRLVVLQNMLYEKNYYEREAAAGEPLDEPAGSAADICLGHISRHTQPGHVMPSLVSSSSANVLFAIVRFYFLGRCAVVLMHWLDE